MDRSSFFHLARLFLISLIVALIGMGVFAKRGWIDWQRILQRNSELQAQIEKVSFDKQNLERQVEALQSNPAEQEHVIRQVLGYVKPQETVIEFQ